MMTKVRFIGEWILIAFFLCVVALIFQQIATSLTAQGVASGDALFNAALFPEIVAGTIVGLSLVLAAFLILRNPEQEQPDVSQASEEQLEEPANELVLLKRRQIELSILLIIYLLILEPVGFHLSTIAIVSAMVWRLGARPFYLPIFTGILITLAISVLFEGLLKVVLPVGYFQLTPPYGLLGL